MNRFQFKVASAALLPSIATMLFVQACGGGGAAIAQTAPDPLVGVWESVVTQRNCTTDAVLGTFRGTQVYHAGGTLTDTNSSPPTSRGPGFGVWVNSGSTYATRFRFYRYNPDGTLAGSSIVSRTLTLAADGNSGTAATRAQVVDANGTVLQEVCASDTTTRFK